MLKSLNKVFAALSMMILFAAPAIAEDAPMEIAGAKTVNAEQIIALFDAEPDLVVLDIRKEADYKSGHIEGAVQLLNTDVNADTMAANVPAKDAAVLMYCNGIKCGRAADAVKKALDLGYTKIHYYALGMAEWKERNLPLVTN